MTTGSSDAAGRRRFELKRRIGAGAFGEVFLAEQVSGGGFRRPVAIKLLNETASRMREASRRMRDEARILGRLSHRHIVEVLDLVQLGDRWAVVMAYVPGADLEQVLASSGPVPGPAACAVGAAVGRALSAAWSAEDDQGRPMRVVHRDIKPSNVRLTDEGEVKVLDFGVARVDLEGREAQTRRPGLIGTEIYMSPERLLLEGDGPEGDVYALAATVVELLKGEAVGRSPVRDEAHARFVDEAVSDLTTRLRGPDELVDEVVRTLRAALDADPRLRPDAATLARVLDEGARRLDGPSLVAWSAEVVPGAASHGALTQQMTTGTLIEGQTPRSLPTFADLPDDEPPASPRRWLLLAGGLGLAGVAVAAFVVLRSSPTPSVAPPAPEPAPVAAPVIAPPPVEAPAPAEPPVQAPPVEPTPAPKAAPRAGRPKAAEPVAAPAAPVAASVAAVEAPRVSRAMIVVADVSGIEVRCGDRTFHGTSSVRVVDFPAGDCTVRAERSGAWSSTRVAIDAPREVNCTLTGGTLGCR